MYERLVIFTKHEDIEMEIDVEKYLTDAMKNQIIDDVRRDITAQVKQQFDYKQIAAEIKNLVVKEVSKEVADRVIEKYKANEIIEKSMATISARLHQKIHSKLAGGITVKFEGLGE